MMTIGFTTSTMVGYSPLVNYLTRYGCGVLHKNGCGLARGFTPIYTVIKMAIGYILFHKHCRESFITTSPVKS
jgi:hypothetical protein